MKKTLLFFLSLAKSSLLIKAGNCRDKRTSEILYLIQALMKCVPQRLESYPSL